MAGPGSFKHFILTPYCVRFEGLNNERDKKLRASPEWLDRRFDMFKDFCFPSVKAQTNQNFTWLLFFDPQVPESYLDRIRGLIGDTPNVKIAICDGFDHRATIAAVQRECGPDIEWLLTTRLDNDDGLHKEFVETLQAAQRFERREFLNFSAGIIYFEGKCYFYKHLSNAFISLAEPLRDCLTVWCGPHPSLSLKAPIRQITRLPGFLQVVHQRTRSNKPRGTLVPRTLALQGFEAIKPVIKDEAIEDNRDLLIHNVTTTMAWNTRDWVINSIRTMARRQFSSPEAMRAQPQLIRRILGE